MNETGAPSWDRLVHAAPLPRLEARILLEAASGRRREWLIAHGEEPADADAVQGFAALVARRVGGEPIAYLVGAREFAGRRFETTPDVLIPRPETEQLVQLVLERAPRNASVLDLGTGSGAIAVTLACERDDLRIVATDRSRAAIEVARRNARALCDDALANARLTLREGSWWEPIGAAERFDAVVSNPPYVAADDPHLREGDLRFEPVAALCAGRHGMDALRAIVEGARAHLAADGWIALEHGCDQGESLRELLSRGPWRDVETLHDAAGLARITFARPFL